MQGDYLTFEEQSYLIRKRKKEKKWKWAIGSILAAMVFVVLIIWFGCLIVGSPNEEEATSGNLLLSPIAVSEEPTSLSSFSYEGDLIHLMKFPGLGPIDKSAVREITIRNTILSGPQFSSSLNGFLKLEKLNLENVRVEGEFSRVFLPSLTDFNFEQIHFPNENTDPFKVEEKLKSFLFFDKVQNIDWDIVEDVGNLNVNINFFIGGAKLLGINRTKGEIEIDVPFCEGILKNIKWPHTILSVSNCSMSAEVIRSDLTYVNLYEIIISQSDLEKAISSFTRLESFYAGQKGHSIQLDDFPKTLTELSVSDLDMKYTAQFDSQIKNLYVGGILEDDIFDKLDGTFKNINKFALYGLGRSAHRILKGLMENTKATWMVFGDFKREENSNVKEISEVEEILGKIGVPKGEKYFLVTRDSNGGFVGRSLTEYENYFYHYTLLAWYKFDNFEFFMREYAGLNYIPKM